MDMKNLSDRMREWGALPEPRKNELLCPLSGQHCHPLACAHFNHDTRECIHVEAARAQARAAEALTGLYSLLEQVLDDDGCLYVKVSKE